MIYKFKVLSEEDVKFFMDVEIMSDQTFYEFHNFIQEELEYDSSIHAKFYVSDHNWQRKQEILLVAGKKQAKGTLTMSKAILKDFIKDAHQKLIYVFDIINDRALYIELSETISNTSSRYYPICTDFGGEIPPQFGKKANKINMFEDEEDDIDVFRNKKNAPVLDEDDETFTPEPFDKDIQFDIDDVDINEEEEEESDTEEKEDFDDENDAEDEK